MKGLLAISISFKVPGTQLREWQTEQRLKVEEKGWKEWKESQWRKSWYQKSLETLEKVTSGKSPGESGMNKVNWSGKFGMRQSEFIEVETVEDTCLPGHMQRFSVLICSLAYCPRMPRCDAISLFSRLQNIPHLMWPKASLKPDTMNKDLLSNSATFH